MHQTFSLSLLALSIHRVFSNSCEDLAGDTKSLSLLIPQVKLKHISRVNNNVGIDGS